MTEPLQEQAEHAIDWCHALAGYTEESGYITRTFLSPPMKEVLSNLTAWMETIGMRVSVDSVGNLLGSYDGLTPEAPRVLIGSHLDTVPRAGAYDGVLGVVMGISLVEMLEGRRLPVAIDVVGFSEEEGVRFGAPFIGSRAFTGTLDDDLLELHDAEGHTIEEAVRHFGLEPAKLKQASLPKGAVAYLEFHIEQGPVLENLNLPVGVVDSIAGQSRFSLRFGGEAGHAGTTPMTLRRDALAGAAEWIVAVEQEASRTQGMVATVGQLAVEPGAGNIIPGAARASLDVRHKDDVTRTRAVSSLLNRAKEIADRRGLELQVVQRLDQAATAMDAALVNSLAQAVAGEGIQAHRMPSGAGHDAMILAPAVPSCMLFLRSPGGISHHPDEAVLPEDVAAALAVGRRWLSQWEQRYG